MIRQIVKYPNKILFEKSKTINEVNDKVLSLIKDMTETMYAENGLGISAIQIGEPVCLFLIDGKLVNQETPLVFINPQIIEYSNEKTIEQEGCLSFTDIFLNVKRSTKIKIEYINEKEQVCFLEAEGLLARAIQHENDHLIGKLLIDYASFVLKRSINNKFKRLHRTS